jgi:hypothetical protein
MVAALRAIHVHGDDTTTGLPAALVTTMRRANKLAILNSLSRSMLGGGGNAVLTAILKNLRILGQALPRPDKYERARMATVEVVLRGDKTFWPYWLRFQHRLADLTREADAAPWPLTQRQRTALQFLKLFMDVDVTGEPFE